MPRGVPARGDGRRFMLLVASALAALGMLGLVMRAGSEADSTAAASPSSRAQAGSLGSAAPPPSTLQPLLTAQFEDRFPGLERQTPQESPPRSSPLRDMLIVSYYGNPNSARMGILGTAEPEIIAADLEDLAARYDRLNGAAGVMPALHLVYGVAQPHPAQGGRYVYYLEDARVRRFLTLAEERGMLLFLDLQIGRSSVEEEVKQALPYLRHPRVHLALDPEFAMGPDKVPGEVIGSLHADDINRAQAMLQELVEAEGLPPKLLIVHQFVDSMVRGGGAIRAYPDVELVIDMDGFGSAVVKEAIYRRYASRPYSFHDAIKLFFRQDTDLMSEGEVLALEPRPAVIIYQ